MARNSGYDDDDEFDNIRPGDLDNVFEFDDERFDIESENETDSTDESDEDFSDDYEEYAYDSEKPEEYDENPDVENDDVSEKDEEKSIEDMIDESSVEDSETEEKIEVTETDESSVEIETSEEDLSVAKPMFTEEGPTNVQEAPGGPEVPEQFKNDTEEVTQPEEEQPEMSRPMIDDDPEDVPTEETTEDTVATVEVSEESEAVEEIAKDLEGDKLSEVEIDEPIRDEYQEKVDEGERTSQEDIPDDIKDIVDEEINNKPKISEEEIPDEVKNIVDEELNDSEIPDIETPSDRKAKEKEAEEKAKESSEEDYNAFMIESFKNRVNEIYDKYREDDLLNYIGDYTKGEDNKDNKDLIKDIYIQEFVKYDTFIHFNENPKAKQALWVLVAGVFADMIESFKINGRIEPTITPNKHGVSSEIVEDENIEAIKAHKRQQNDKYAEYKLDRTIFDISEDEDEANCSIFDDKKTLHKDFYESEFYKIHKEVLTSDRFADMSKVESVVIINERTSYIPIIDYSTGIRVVCIDPTDTDQYHLNPMLIHRRVPFSFGNSLRNVTLRVLYRDDCKNCPFAVVAALKKAIAYKYIKDRYKITLNRNYTIGYTTEPKYINMFNYGDPDSHSPENCPSAHEKPFNLQIGIIILDKKSENDRRAIRRNQIRRDLGQYEKVSVEDYDIQFVLSANIIKNDLRLRNPTLPANERYVEYLITQYTECNPVIIKDGLQIISACIIKEHMRNYDAGTGYSISLEYDRDGLISPAIIGMLNDRDGISPTLGSKPNAMDVDGQFILPQSRLKLDGVFPFEKGRIDKRFFSPATVQRKYPRDLWNNYDLSTRDGRLEFIRSRGFEEFIHLKPVQFDIEPYALNMLSSSDMIRNITRISMEMLGDRNSEDTEAMLFKQSELEYIKSMGNDKIGSFQKFLFSVMDYILDEQATKNKERR